jgi:hypothetical protein
MPIISFAIQPCLSRGIARETKANEATHNLPGAPEATAIPALVFSDSMATVPPRRIHWLGRAMDLE